VPERFWDVQWTRLTDDAALTAFVERVRRLLSGQPAQKSSTSTFNPAAEKSAEAPGRAPVRRGKRLLWLGIGAVVLLGAVTAFFLRPKGAPPAPTVAAAGSQQSVAILPFVDMSEKKDQEYFSDGISEELIDLVSRGTNLRVPARTSSFFFKGKQVTIGEMAQALGVANVLEGSIRKAGNTIRVTVQLIRAADGSHLWSATYDRELKDIFKVQDEIAATVVDALKSHLSSASGKLGRPSNPDAHNEYLLGKQAFSRGNADGFRSAIDSFHRAIELDPSYGAAYAELATAEAYWADNGGGPADVQQALKDADKAVELSPNLPDGYVSRGLLRFSRNWDWTGAEDDLKKAVSLDGNDANAQRRYGSLLAALGRVSEGVTAAKKAIDLDPLSNAAWGNLGVYYTSLGEYADGRKALNRAIEINPGSIYSHWNLGILEMLDGHVDVALTVFPKNDATAFRQAGLAMAEHSLKNPAKSKEALGVLTTKMGDQWAYQIAEVYAWRGESDDAFTWLKRAYSQHDGGLIQIKYDRLLTSVRSDPRYLAFLQQMHLPP
jgi:TolB-like protein/Flp pilus assembly protein TadD